MSTREMILISLVTVFLIIIIFLYCSGGSKGSSYKEEFDGIQERLDSMQVILDTEKNKTDSFTVIREYYHEQKEIMIEKLDYLPLDSSVLLLKENLILYEKAIDSTRTSNFRSK